MPNPKWKHLMNGKETNKWQGFDKNPQNIHWKWRPISFRNEFKKMLESDGTMVLQADHIKKIHEDGRVTINVPKKEMLVLKALNWAMGNKGAESTKMIQWVVEMFEWKAKQNVWYTDNEGNDIIKISPATEKLINEAL